LTLSDDQQAAVLSDETAIALVAGAGTGKTEVVARRIERLLLDAPQEEFRVLALTYTVKSADELRERFASRLSQLARRVDTDTLHGFAHRLLRQHGTRIGLPIEPELLVRDDDRFELLARWLEDEGRPPLDDPRTTFVSLDLARARLESAPLLAAWDAALEAARALDYPSLLDKATELLALPSARRQLIRVYGHVIVDEAQNLTPAQYRMLVTLVGEPNDDARMPLMVVGDDKQSIVSFAGADSRLIGTFQAAYGARRFELHRNFRSARRIVAVASRVAQDLGHTGARADAPELSFAADGRVESHASEDEPAEAELVASWVSRLLQRGIPSDALAEGESSTITPSDVAILARSAIALRRVEAAIGEAGHPTASASSPAEWLASPVGALALELMALRASSEHLSTRWALARALGCDEARVTSIDGAEQVMAQHSDPQIRALADILRVDEPSTFIADLSGLPAPSEAVGGGAADQAVADWDGDVRLLVAAWERFCVETSKAERTWGGFRLFISRLQRGDDLAPGVRLLTIHKAQGREYRVVAIVGLNDGQFPDFRATSTEDRLSELRTFYVAITRPTRLLLLSRAHWRQTRYGVRATQPSPFLAYVDQLANT
jgi:DNA helicase-2/ATP-dependent DNA helicase PcrA